MTMGFAAAWGAGRGAALRLSPAARLACGFFVLVTCVAAPLETWPGAALAGGAAAAWLAAAGLPWGRLARAAAFAGAMFVPMAAVLAAVAAWEAGAWGEAWQTPLIVAVRGTLCVLTGAATAGTLRMAELEEALARTPVPRAVVVVILQVVWQTALMTDETRRVVLAARARGAGQTKHTRFILRPSPVWSARTCSDRTGQTDASQRLRAGTPALQTFYKHLVWNLPTVWLTRLALRAERVGLAMEMRGFAEPTVAAQRPSTASGRCAAMLAAGVALAAVATRLWWLTGGGA